MMRLQTPQQIKKWRREQSQSVGFVPTMGALHEGHLSLIERSQHENQKTVVSIFVNPLQFNNAGDLKNYPRPLEKDLQLLETLNVDVAWIPEEKDLYPAGKDILIQEKDLSQKLCGVHRPGHFEGMLTVVMKLLQVTQPTRAYFGEKDHQQLELIRKMVSYFFMDVDIVACPTLRDERGLAMSSRNLLLSEKARQQAPALYKVLKTSPSQRQALRELETLGFRVEYVEDIDHRRYAAAWLENVRLIDNVEI